MKRLVLLFLVLAFAVSCQKITLSKGVYAANTPEGKLYLELLSGHDCEAYFQPNNKESGSYYISDGEIDLIIHADSGMSTWWFGGKLGKGQIKGTSFTIQAQRMRTLTPEYLEILFVKQ